MCVSGDVSNKLVSTDKSERIFFIVQIAHSGYQVSESIVKQKSHATYKSQLNRPNNLFFIVDENCERTFKNSIILLTSI